MENETLTLETPTLETPTLETPTLKVAHEKVVNILYTLKEEGEADHENSQEGLALAYLHGHGNILAGLESALTGMTVGDTTTVTLAPAEAYGPRNENALQRVPIKHLVGKYKRLRPGMLVRINTEEGTKNGRILKVGKYSLDLDMNHPLAGKTLIFSVEIKSIRGATHSELLHGHAHDEAGHQH